MASCLFSNAVWSRLASDDVTRCSSRLFDLFGTRPNLTAENRKETKTVQLYYKKKKSIMILSFWTDMSGQTVQTKVRLFDVLSASFEALLQWKKALI